MHHIQMNVCPHFVFYFFAAFQFLHFVYLHVLLKVQSAELIISAL